MKFAKFNLGFYCLVFVSHTFSQTTSPKLNASKQDSSGKDIIDVLKFKRPVDERNTSRKNAGKARVSLIPFVGYTLQTRLAAIIAGNVAFYSDNAAETNQSAIVASVSYSQNNQLIFPILSNIWTRKNKYNFLGNWRYYKYPENTYGLGGHTTSKNPTKLDYSYILFRESLLRHISNSSVYAGIGYNLSIHKDITQLNASGMLTDFDLYGRPKNSVSSGISFHVLFDNRGNTINPMKGMYTNITYCPYFKFIGGDNNWQSLTVDFRKYFKLGHSKNILAFWSYNWFTFGSKAPYLDLPSTGWEAYTMGRGYIQSRLRGKNLVYAETEYRFTLSRNGLFGGVIFANAQSVSDWPGNKFTTIYPAIGSGIRVKLNKYSGTNLSIDYGFGIKGSRGLFINVGEVF